MAKPCPIDPTHQTKEIPMGSTTFTLCSHPDCKEDVEYLAKQVGKTWCNDTSSWIESDFEEVEDEDLDDLDDALNPPYGPAAQRPPITPNMRPQLDLGAGTHQLVLISTDDVEANYVKEILETALNKNPVAAAYLVQDAHFKGRTVVKYGTQVEMQTLLNQVDTLKNQLSQSGRMFADTIANLQMVVEQTTP